VTDVREALRPPDALDEVIPPPTVAPPLQPPPPPGARWVPVRRAALVAYGLFFVFGCATWGVPLDRERVVLWTCGALLCASIGRSPRAALHVALDWLPFVAVLFVYDLSRGAAENLGLPVHYTPQLDADRWLFGGEVPTVWLQDRMLEPGGPVRWWDVVLALVYSSHFIVPFAVAGALWARSRARFHAYAKRFVTLSFAGVATFVLFPAAPPWLASRLDYLPHVYRTAGRGWEAMGLDVAERMLERGQSTVNLVAAVPSLHSAYALLITLFLWSRARPLMRVLLAAYPVAMGFTLVATGEHYVVDVLLGWAFAVAVMVAWGRWDRRRAAGGTADTRAAAGA
jgi:hypothetical protein